MNVFCSSRRVARALNLSMLFTKLSPNRCLITLRCLSLNYISFFLLEAVFPSDRAMSKEESSATVFSSYSNDSFPLRTEA